MNTIIPIPHGVMRALNCDWDIDWRTQSSGEGLNGVEQVFPSPFPRWIGSPTLSLYGEALRLWRSTRAKAQGRANVYRVPLIDKDDIPDMYGARDHAGRPLNGPGYSEGPLASVDGARAAGATEFNATTGFYPILEGAYISIGSWPYIVTGTQRIGHNRVTVSVQPPLRRAIAAADPINLRAHGLFRATDDSMGRVDVGPNGFAQVDLSFVEWIGPGRP